ncbi:MAG: hypothetical protein M1376_11415 [Planctomycetes bacterium]|nr:hypothetical protein [Planctomycetota bacterium]
MTKNSTQDGTPKRENATFGDPDLREVMAAWPDLPADVKRPILYVCRSYARPVDAARRRADVLDAMTQAQSEDRRQDRHYPKDADRDMMGSD